MYNAIKPITIEPRYLLIALLPVILFIGGEYLIFSGTVFPTVPHAGSFDSTQEATGRYVFYAAFLLFATMCLATVAVTSVDIGSLFDKAGRLRLFAVAAGLAAIVLLVCWAQTHNEQARTYWLAGQGFFDSFFRAACESRCKHPDALKAIFSDLLLISNGLIGLGAAMAIVGTISCLGGIRGGDTDPPAAELIETQSQRLHYYLYLSSAILVTGVLVIYGWLHWPASFAEKPDDYRALANALLLFFGVNYSLTIFSFYVPVALILSEHAPAASATESDAREPAKKGMAGFAALPETFRTVLALLAPFLTAALTPILDLIMGAGSGG